MSGKGKGTSRSQQAHEEKLSKERPLTPAVRRFIMMLLAMSGVIILFYSCGWWQYAGDDWDMAMRVAGVGVPVFGLTILSLAT